MKRLTLLLCWLSAAVSLQAKDLYALVISHEESFTMQSPSSGVYRVKAVVTVINENGLRQATPVIYTDSFRSIGSFSAEIETAGRKIKFGKKDLQTVSISSGLADDSYVSVYEPSARYPFTISYEYAVNYRNGVLTFPAFVPVTEEKVELQKGSYTLDLPAGTEIVSYASHAEAVPPREAKGRTVYEWKVADVQAIADEDMMPPFRELLPMVLAAPRSFSYAGTTGTQSDWKEFGLWVSGLQQGADVLPDAVVAELRELTAGCSSDFEKLRVLYGRLRETTRYVAIQLGIGKLKPIEAAEVARSGFGDCKALSNYLMAMLKAVGVESYYYIIHTDRKDLLPGFTSAGQMNHAMLAVPLPEMADTVFVECTNPRIPLGYRHADVAGHEIVLIKPDGGEHVRVGAYPDSLSRREQRTEVKLSTNGSASLKLCRRMYLDLAENYIGWEDLKQDTRERMLTAGFKLHPEGLTIDSVSDNFDGYAAAGRAFCPEKTISYSFSTRVYAHGDGTRLFVPMNPVAKGLSFQKGERVNDIVIPEGYVSVDTVIVRLPLGYAVESLPEPVELDTPWASFSATASEADGCVTVVQAIRFKRFRSDKSRYPEFRDFARKVNRCYDSSFVLITSAA